MSMKRTGSSPSSKSPRIRRPCPANRRSRSAAWASTCSRRHYLIDLLQTRRGGREFEPRFRQGHHPLYRQERQSGRAPLLAVLRHLDRGGEALLAGRRHRRRLLGRQHRPHRHRARPRPLRPRLADLDLRRDHAAGQVRPRRRRPARSRDLVAALGRLHRLGRRDQPIARFHRRARPFLFDDPRGRHSALCQHRAATYA